MGILTQVGNGKIHGDVGNCKYFFLCELVPPKYNGKMVFV